MTMKLQQVVLAKIVITVLLWSGPLLLFPLSWLAGLGFPQPEAFLVFYRLLGAAYAALLVAYIYGLFNIMGGGSPGSTVVLGLVSNGLAAMILGIFGFQGAWSAWGFWAWLYMWGSLALTAALALALFISWIMTDRGQDKTPAK
jgi:hypothetical protein